MNVAIIVAAGRGTRMNDRDVPKQFRMLGDVPLVIHTLRRFEQASMIDHTILVLPAEHQARIDARSREPHLSKLKRIVVGGDTRAESVRNALDSLRDIEEEPDATNIDIVAVHDGARPFVAPEEIDSCVRAAREHGAAILCAPVTDTIKQVVDNRVIGTPPRTCMRRALTPQCFQVKLLREAYAAAPHARNATDDSSLVERLGYAVRALNGDPRNIKITTPEDWIIAEEIIKQVMSDE